MNAKKQPSQDKTAKAQPAKTRGRKKKTIAEDMEDDATLSETTQAPSSADPIEEDEDDAEEVAELGMEREDDPEADVAGDDGEVLDKLWSKGRKKEAGDEPY